MSDFMTQTYYGNTIQQWAISLGIVVAAILAGKILYWFFSTVMRRLTAKTNTRLDDIIIDMIEEPIVLAATIFGAWLGLGRLTFSEQVDKIIGDVMQGVIVLSVTWLFVRLLDSLITQFLVPLAEKSENDLDDQLLPIFRRTSKAAVWAIGVVVALNNAGYEVGAIIAGLGIGGLALAMAAQDTVSNVFGGFTIFTDRPFGLGDRIRMSGHDGTVEEIGLRSTRIRTLAGTLVTVPNSSFSDGVVENVSAEPNRKVALTLGLTYDTTPDQMDEAQTLLRTIIDETEGVEEKVVVGFTGFGDFAMEITFIYYVTAGADIVGTQSAVNSRILRDFNECGLEFAFPTQTLIHQNSGGAAA